MNLYAIYGANSNGTTFYKITRDDVISVFDSENVNIFLKTAFQLKGWKTFDIDSLYGSKIIDDVLYLCSTDGVEIEIDGEWIDPEEALDFYSPEDLENYIEDPTVDVIKHNLSSYELKQADMQKVTHELKSEGYSYSEIYRAMHDLEIQ